VFRKSPDEMVAHSSDGCDPGPVRPRVLVLVALVSLVIALWLAVESSGGPPAERAAGVSRDAAGRVEIDYVLCGAQRLHFVRLLDYAASSGNGEVGPVMWQAHSGRGAAVPAWSWGAFRPASAKM
jgi:hypothetical protein